ncbi:alpha/beta hydrolase [Leifsonia kafniensis]|uniref:Alpha/beta hydrolase n=1 Tax=Leifsonia kafniensis TaxID=475957 RepID=A0ABP7KCU6_9MICO
MRLEVTSLIDPVLWALVDESRAFYARRRPGHGPISVSELIAVREAMPVPAECEPFPSVETVSTGGRSVPVRIHTPSGRPAAGVLLEIHTGGFYLGSAAGSDVRNRRLVDALGIAVVSVDYRLAPENPWPAAPDDCETAALWLVENAEARFGTTRLAMSGFSAGSTLVAATLIRLRDRGIDAFGGAVVQCGTYDLSAQTPAGRLIADEYFLGAYAGDAPDRTDPDMSPIFAELTNLPPILMVIGTDDVLFEDNLAMTARLLTAGVDVDLRVYPASPHAFTGHATSMATAALETIDEWLRGQIGETV